MTTRPNPAHPHAAADPPDASCLVDRTCGPAVGCGCGAPAATAERAGPSTATRGFRAALVAVACAVGCLAIPLVAGGVVALSGAVAGGWWLAGAGVLVAIAVAVVGSALLRRRTTARAG